METEGQGLDEISGIIFLLAITAAKRCGGVWCQCNFFVTSICLFFVFQSCDIKVEGRKRFLSLKNVQLDQAGEVSYQALNAVTSAMLSVKGRNLSQTKILLFSIV